MKRKWRWVVVVLVWAVLVCLGTRYVDPDFGWHLRLGEIITKKGIPATDPFSYAMPSYHFVDYEWVTNVLLYLAYQKIGHTGLVIIYAAIMIISGLVVVPKKLREYSDAPVVLFWSVALSIFGARPQVISWLFMALILRGIWDDEWGEKWMWGFPALMLVWVNLHGSYPLGVGFVGLWLGARWLVSRRWESKKWLVWGMGGLATLINPYGIREIGRAHV
jgi:hypothetical protein